MDSKIISVDSRRKKPVYNKQLGVIFNGEDNLYDVLVDNLIKSSPTTKQCCDIYGSFLAGSGFTAQLVEETTGNLLEARGPEDLLNDVTDECKTQQGVWIHIGYNAAFEKVSHEVIPYEFCKLGKKDSKDYVGKIIMNPDGWDRLADKKKIKVYDTYNPRPEVIQAQVERDGGWDNYKGQILYFKLNNERGSYAESLVENCYMFSDTEANLGLHYNRMVRKGFKDAWILRHKKFDNKQKQQAFEKNVKMVYGNEHAGGVLMVEDEFSTENKETSKFQFDFLEDKTKADKYKHFEESSANFIRKAFFNIPPQILDFVQGKLGNTSGDDLRAAESLYNKATAKHRKKLERLFAELYRNYHLDINPSKDWTIGQYALMEDGTIEEDETAPSNNQE
ncbi:hypothetical protein [uncultured Christiangramia sp.]|uniref:hypothetical protein n=1 Tax=uncultured Christiangramia sp. TaxID=503836 RepID=UPI00260563D1|nr:hypothetical protein [uncultured Christiangramia sp.]